MASEPQMPARIGRVTTHPSRGLRLVDVVEPEWQPVEQLVDVVARRRIGLAGRSRGAEEECLHGAGRPRVTSATEASSTSWAAIARIPAKNASASAVFISTTAFMSGT